MRKFALGLLIAAATAPAWGHDHGKHGSYSAGEPGDPSKPARTMRNVGTEDHEFLLATTKENVKHAELMKKHSHVGHDDLNGVRVAPKKTAEILWKFTNTGTVEYSCLIPDHREYGMTGQVMAK
jgi:uncharacterized cupredoxin-like copper-binding protein